MKKLLYLFTASLLAFTSCSKDDNDSSDPASSILVKKITMVASDGDSSTENYLYNGNKIVSMTEADGSVTKYTYTGDLITKIEELDVTGTLNLTTNYNYVSGRLDNSIRKHSAESYYYKTIYIYNADGTVSYDNFRGVASTGVEQEYGATGKFTFKEGNVVKLEVSYYGNDRSYVYEYDTKNNPFKNVTGLSLLLDDDTAVNNIVKKTAISGSGANITTIITTYSYKYNANNYPTEKVETFSNGNSTFTETTQYSY